MGKGRGDQRSGGGGRASCKPPARLALCPECRMRNNAISHHDDSVAPRDGDRYGRKSGGVADLIIPYDSIGWTLISLPTSFPPARDFGTFHFCI